MTLDSQSSRSGSPFWIFNGLMLWGAGLGFLIVLASGELRDAIYHKGPGVVHHGDGERSPEWSEEVSEAEYKSNEYVQNGMLLALGLWLWYVVAKFARDEAAKAKAEANANAEYLQDRINALGICQRGAQQDRTPKDDDGARESLLADLLDYAIIGAAHLERGATDFARWSELMLSEGDPAIRPFLPSIFENAKRIQEHAHKILPEQD